MNNEEQIMKLRSFAAYFLSAGFLLVSVVLGPAHPAAAQENQAVSSASPERIHSENTCFPARRPPGRRPAHRLYAGDFWQPGPNTGIADMTAPLAVLGASWQTSSAPWPQRRASLRPSKPCETRPFWPGMTIAAMGMPLR